jgi:hypothetical protein
MQRVPAPEVQKHHNLYQTTSIGGRISSTADAEYFSHLLDIIVVTHHGRLVLYCNQFVLVYCKDVALTATGTDVARPFAFATGVYGQVGPGRPYLQPFTCPGRPQSGLVREKEWCLVRCMGWGLKCSSVAILCMCYVCAIIMRYIV